MFSLKLKKVQANERSSFHDLWEHFFKDYFECHCVAATASGLEEITVTLPVTLLEMDNMRIIGSIKGDSKGFNADSVTFFSISLGFFNLSDHSIIHNLISFQV